MSYSQKGNLAPIDDDGTVRSTESTLMPMHYSHDDGTRSLVRRTNKTTTNMHKILLLALSTTVFPYLRLDFQFSKENDELQIHGCDTHTHTNPTKRSDRPRNISLGNHR